MKNLLKFSLKTLTIVLVSYFLLVAFIWLSYSSSNVNPKLEIQKKEGVWVLDGLGTSVHLFKWLDHPWGGDQVFHLLPFSFDIPHREIKWNLGACDAIVYPGGHGELIFDGDIVYCKVVKTLHGYHFLKEGGFGIAHFVLFTLKA